MKADELTPAEHDDGVIGVVLGFENRQWYKRWMEESDKGGREMELD